METPSSPGTWDATLQSTVSIVRIDTLGVVVDEDWDKEWTDIEISLVQGSGSTPPALDDAPAWSGHGAIHLRGNSSMDYDKKQYALESRDADGEDIDAYVLSTWMHKDRGGKLNMGPIWDFNGSLGNADYFESWEIEGWHYNNPEFPADNPNGFAWYAKMLEDDVFQQRLSERWAAHRAGPWSDAQLLADIDAVAALLGDAATRNFERWPVLGEHVWPNDFGAGDRTTYAEELDYLKTWLVDRTAWLDTQLMP